MLHHVSPPLPSFSRPPIKNHPSLSRPTTIYILCWCSAPGLPAAPSMSNPQDLPPGRASPTVDADTPFNPEFIETYRVLQEGYRRSKEQTRRLFQNRPQSWRHVLRLLCTFHFSILAGRFVGDLLFNGLQFSELNVLSAIGVVMALATRITWNALFVNPYSFLGYRRPGTAYRFAVYVATVVTTIPALIVHVAMIRTASKIRRPFNINYGQTILQLALLVPAIGLYVWMVRHFLLRHNDEHYEPTVSRPLGEESARSPAGRRGDVPPELGSPTPSQSSSGHLSQIYARQRRRIASDPRPNPQVVEPTTASEASPPDRLDQSESATFSPDRRLLPHPLRCQTIAWFDYIPRSRLSDPLIPLILGVYGTFVAWLVYLLIQENSLSKLGSRQVSFPPRFPSCQSIGIAGLTQHPARPNVAFTRRWASTYFAPTPPSASPGFPPLRGFTRLLPVLGP